MRWDVPSSETTVIDALDSITTGQMLLYSALQKPDRLASPMKLPLQMRPSMSKRNEPPVVSITAPARLNPGESAQISASAIDPEGRPVTFRWEATDGTIDNPTAQNPNFTASSTPGPVTLTCYGTDADGVEGSSTHVIVINSPPTVVITAPSRLEVE